MATWSTEGGCAAHARDGDLGHLPGPNLSRRNQEHQVYPYLLRGVPIIHVNQVWGIDITYIRLIKGWMYLVAIIDWYSRYVVSWQFDQTLEISFVLEAVRKALQVATPVIMNSDQGSHFTSPQYIDLLKVANVQISMDGKGRATDNIFTERLWRSLKYEEVYLHEYRTPRDAREGIAGYLQFYNEKRLHQSLNYRTHAERFYDVKSRRMPMSRSEMAHFGGAAPKPPPLAGWQGSAQADPPEQGFGW